MCNMSRAKSNRAVRMYAPCRKVNGRWIPQTASAYPLEIARKVYQDVLLNTVEKNLSGQIVRVPLDLRVVKY